MKKAILLSILLLVLFMAPSKAQILEERLSPSVDSTQMIVQKGRQMIIDKLKEKDYSKVKEIYHDLENKTMEKESSPFDYTEYLYINLLLEDWALLNDYMATYHESENIIPYLVNDPLKDILFDKVVESSDSLLNKIKNAPIDKEEKSVIELLIHLMKSNTPDNMYYRLLDEHNREYKKSKYSDFIIYFLPAPRNKEGYSFSIGSGMIFPTGKFDESFSQRQCFYASMDINYNKFFGSFYAQAAGLKLEVPFILNIEGENIDYLKDDVFNYQDFGVKGGYFLLRSNRFHIGPYATLNGIILKTTDYDFWERLSQKVEDDENWEYKIINSFCLGGGMHSEIKVFEAHKITKKYNLADKYVSLKADAGYNYITDHDIKLFKGNTWYFTLALVYGVGIF